MKFFILCIVQGIAEFLPISSSGHLAILGNFFNFGNLKFGFTIYLHLATLLAIIFYFFFDVIKLLKEKKELFHLLLGFITTVIVALLLKNSLLYFFDNYSLIGVSFLITAFSLFLSDLKKNPFRDITAEKALIIGLAQGLSVLPGISRSGLTIATGILLGVKREKAFRFSFLLAMPTIFSAALFEAKEIKLLFAQGNFSSYIFFFIVTFLLGLFSLRLFSIFLTYKKLSIFGIYCCIIGIISLSIGGLK